jgi:predicted transcriptional regulator
VTFYPHSDIKARLEFDVPINVSVNVPVNERQQWFLNQLGIGKRFMAADFARHWNVALKTAKRDIAELKEQGIIEFVGPPKTGIYRFMQDLALSIDR